MRHIKVFGEKPDKSIIGGLMNILNLFNSKPLTFQEQVEATKKFFSKISEERDKRDGLVEFTNAWGHSETRPAWNIYEMEQLLAYVNKKRSANNLPVLDLVKFSQIERECAGHSDYSHKLCLYSTRLFTLDYSEVYKDAADIFDYSKK